MAENPTIILRSSDETTPVTRSGRKNRTDFGCDTSQPIELEQGTNPKQTLTGTNKYSYIKTVLTLLQS
jgi:hypothetical protein